MEQGTGTPKRSEDLVEKVRERYGKIAEGTVSGCCGASPTPGCGSSEDSVALGIGYSSKDLSQVPEGANLGLGCGAPVAALDLRPGETVLDLGSGPGLDAFLAARKVAPEGRVIGVDMTPEMLAKAREGARKAGIENVEFRQGRLEALPVESGSVDAVTSNCVINLVPDKAAVFKEVARVLRPGGRLVVSDIILDGPLPDVVASDLLAYVGCVSGAMLRRPYFGLLESAGLGEITLLKDLDYLGAAGYELPAELRGKMARAGVGVEDLEGKVRSVTYRAVKPANA